LDDAFELLISRYMADQVGTAEDFLNSELGNALAQRITSLHDEQKFKEAGIGSKAKLVQNKSLRSDLIYWLDRNNLDPSEDQFLDLIDRFVTYLNRTCYTGITGYEFHYALYEPGSSYGRHLDQFKDNQSRSFSMIFYLNQDWKSEDGGQLRIYKGEESQTIDPTNLKCVFFKSSELEHEVLTSHKNRLTVTGWLKTGG